MSSAVSPLRVGRIEFANCAPLFLALGDQGEGAVDFLAGVPTALNSMLREGELDLAPSSSVEYLQYPELYGFLPDLSISSIGPVASVMLFSRFPLETLGGRRVALSSASATSVVLVRVLLEGRLGVLPAYVGPEEEADAALRIGDRALEEALRGEWPYVYDLGEIWFRETHTPFVFALWICRRDTFASRPDAVRRFYRQLVRARQLAYRSYPEYARRCPQVSWMGEGGLLAYWQTISYDLTAWHLEGLRRFAADAQAAGLLRSVPPLDPLPVEHP